LDFRQQNDHGGMGEMSQISKEMPTKFLEMGNQGLMFYYLKNQGCGCCPTQCKRRWMKYVYNNVDN